MDDLEDTGERRKSNESEGKKWERYRKLKKEEAEKKECKKKRTEKGVKCQIKMFNHYDLQLLVNVI